MHGMTSRNLRIERPLPSCSVLRRPLIIDSVSFIFNVHAQEKEMEVV